MKATYLYTITSFDLGDNLGCRQVLHDQIDLLMQILPPDTKYIDSEELPVVGLAKQYKVTFEHPWFQQGTEIVTEWRREVYTDPKVGGKVHQFNMLTAIKYFVGGKEI